MLDIVINQAKIIEQLGGIWVIALLVFSRSIGFVGTAPLIGNKQIPALVKISFAVLLTLILMPLIEVPEEYPRGYKFIYLIGMNAIIGMLIGWIASLVLQIGRVAGEMLDMQMALTAATIFDPGSQTQSTIIGHFFDFMALVLFISIGGVHKTIEALLKSYNTFPVVVFQIELNFDKVLKATADLIAISFVIVSPIIIILLTADLILGLMSRAAPQINAFQISFSIKPSLGVLLVLILMPVILQIFAKIFSDPNKYMY